MAARMTRTQFLAALAAGVVAPVLAPRRLLAWTPQRRLRPAVSADTFRTLLQSVFKISSNSGLTRDLVLTNVSARPLWPGTEQFSLEFSCSDGPAIDEGTYPAFHPELGKFEIFLTPVSDNVETQQSVYRADFNLIR